MAPASTVNRGSKPVHTDGSHAEFLEALPHIQAHAQNAFRYVRCVHRQEEYVAEAVALSWKWWLRLRQRGKDPTALVGAIAVFAARAAKSGRRLCGQETAKDALSPVAQRDRGFTVSPLPQISTLCGNPFDEALFDNTRTPVDDQVAF